jgi:hypothetical protein
MPCSTLEKISSTGDRRDGDDRAQGGDDQDRGQPPPQAVPAASRADGQRPDAGAAPQPLGRAEDARLAQAAARRLILRLLPDARFACVGAALASGRLPSRLPLAARDGSSRRAPPSDRGPSPTAAPPARAARSAAANTTFECASGTHGHVDRQDRLRLRVQPLAFVRAVGSFGSVVRCAMPMTSWNQALL